MWRVIVGIFLLFDPIFSNSLANMVTDKRLSPLYPPNLASLQRGAKYFMNYCSGCHSLRFMRYDRFATDLQIIDKFNLATLQRLKENLIFNHAKTSDTIKSSLQEKEALQWFGKPPPDLSLSTRARNIDWVYNYLLGFYLDDTRPFGVNNHLLKNTTMPDPLATLRANTPYIYQRINSTDLRLPLKTNSKIYVHSNKNSPEIRKLEEIVTDLVNFLAYTAEPTKAYRQSLGKKVCGFLLFFIYLVYLLKKQIWKNLK